MSLCKSLSAASGPYDGETESCFSCADMLSLITCAAKQAGEPSTHVLLRGSQVSPQELAKWKQPNAIDMVH